MKIFKQVLIVLLVSLAVTACKKDDDGGGGGSAAEGTVTAKVGGADFTSLKIASTASESSGNGNTTITLQGSDADGKGIFLIINNFDGTGTYEITDDNVFIVATYIETDINNPQNSQTWNAPYNGSGVVGEINVSSKTDTKIKGTFNFDAKNVNGDQSIKSITNGSFDLSF